MGFAFADGDQSLDVADARGQAQQHRRLVLLGEAEGELGHLVGFLRVRRFQHRQMREAAPVARILFVLRGRQADVVGHGDHQATVGAGDGHGHQAVAGDIEADVLHGAEGPRAGHRSAKRDFHRAFFIHRPFGVQVRIARQRFDDLGRRGAGIGGGDAYAGFPDCAGNGLVAGKQEPAGGGRRCQLGHDGGHGALSKQGKKLTCAGSTHPRRSSSNGSGRIIRIWGAGVHSAVVGGPSKPG